MAEAHGITGVFFDVGETLVDESGEYGAWADWLGVPRHTFSAVFGAILARGEDYRQVFQYFRPGFDLATERQRRFEAGLGEYVNASNLYPDARPTLQRLRDLGYLVGVAGNQTTRAGRFLSELHLPVDILATSDDWGAEKPSPDFFRILVDTAGRRPAEILYVGDRFENDLTPARAVGLRTAFVRRGPWGHVQQADPAEVDYWLHDLTELPELLGPSFRTVGA